MKWIVVLISLAAVAAGFALGRLFRAEEGELSLGQRLRRSAGALVAGVGIWFAIAAAAYQPPGPELDCYEDVDAAIVEGRARQLPVFVDFTANWCENCHVLEREALNTPEVVARSDEFVCAKVDLSDEDDPATEAMRQRFGILGLPTIAFLDTRGEVLPQYSIREVVSAGEFLARFEAARAGGAGGYPSPFHQAISEWGILITLGLVFLAGIITSLSPCVYPIIPITISIFGARQAATKLEGFALSCVYVGGMITTYVVLGVVAARVGGLFGQALQSPGVLIGIGTLFAVLGFSSVGLFTMRLPAAIERRLNVGKKGFAGAFSMGLVAGIIAAPCVGPWLAGVLLFIFETQNMVLGTAFMVAFAVGMGLLFLVLGTFSSLIGRIPKSGGWSSALKATFGVVFVVVGFHYISLVFSGFDGLFDQVLG